MVVIKEYLLTHLHHKLYDFVCLFIYVWNLLLIEVSQDGIRLFNIVETLLNFESV